MRSSSGSAGAEPRRPGAPLVRVVVGAAIWGAVALLGPGLLDLGPAASTPPETPLACWLVDPTRIASADVVADPELWRLWPRVGARRAAAIARGERDPSARESARWARLDAEARAATDPSRSRAPPCR
jgi:hypothetical protein